MTTILTMTMAAGKGIPGSTIRYALENNFAKFKRIIVVDGGLDQEAKDYYSKFQNVEVIDSPWEDSYVKQYQAAADQLSEGEWAIWLDDDELLSDELSAFLQNSDKMKGLDCDIVKLPCILHLSENERDYYPAEPTPSNELKEKTWTKNILFRKNDGLWFRYFGSHVIPQNKSGKYQYLSLPYYHMKSFESFVYNDVWQAFLSPQGQGYLPEEVARFKMFTACYKSTKEFKQATKKGTWPPTLKKFAWEKRQEYNRPISRLAWVYWILEGNLMPEIDDFMLWENVKQYVLSNESVEIYKKSKADKKGIVINEQQRC